MNDEQVVEIMRIIIGQTLKAAPDGLDVEYFKQMIREKHPEWLEEKDIKVQ
jgi:hypothetical protein